MVNNEEFGIMSLKDRIIYFIKLGGNIKDQTLSFKNFEQIAQQQLPDEAYNNVEWWDDIFENSGYRIVTLSFIKNYVHFTKI